MLDMPEPWDRCLLRGELLTGNRTSPREGGVLQSSALTSDMEMQNLEFAQMVSSLAFLPMLPSLHFGMVMYVLRHYMVEVCGLACSILVFYR